MEFIEWISIYFVYISPKIHNNIKIMVDLMKIKCAECI